jgi:hypothetical protein
MKYLEHLTRNLTQEITSHAVLWMQELKLLMEFVSIKIWTLQNSTDDSQLTTHDNLLPLDPILQTALHNAFLHLHSLVQTPLKGRSISLSSWYANALELFTVLYSCRAKIFRG